MFELSFAEFHPVSKISHTIRTPLMCIAPSDYDYELERPARYRPNSGAALSLKALQRPHD